MRFPVCKSALPAPGSGSRALCWQAASSGRDSIRYAHSGPSQRLRRPRCARTYIRRVPPPARVRGWTRPPAAASRRLPPFPCAKSPFLPPGPARRGLTCANRPFLPPGPARYGLPCAKRLFLPPRPARLVFPCANRPFLPPGSASRGTGNVENYPGWGWARQNVKTGGVWVEARKAGGGENKRRTCILPYFFRAIIVIFVKTDCQ